MTNLKLDDERHVIPNWRNFNTTAALGELNGNTRNEINKSFKPDLQDLLVDWEEEKSVGFAADILGVALTFNQTNTEEIKSIANYILQNSNLSSKTLINSAKSVFKINNEFNSNQLYIAKDSAIELKSIYIQISKIKNKLKNNPRNVIAWVELSRLYSIQGYEQKAKRAMKNAVFLAPENRYVLRSMARFFTHIGDVEYADNYLKKIPSTKYDPWLMASSISLSDLNGKGSKYAKEGILKIKDNKFDNFAAAELASSLATLELKNGNIKSSKKLFRKSLLNPNDNALAQAEWASQKELKLDNVNPEQFNLSISHEAIARDCFEKELYNKSIKNAKDWFFDMPYSKQAILFGYDVALLKLKNYKMATELGKMGLISHPNDPVLINNIMYSLSLNNQPEDADELLLRLKSVKLERTNLTNICLTATKGLINYRKGNYKEGERLYLEAISLANESKNKKLAFLAFVNLAREKFRFSGSIDVEILNKLYEIKKKSSDIQLIDLVDDVLDSNKN